MVWWFWVALGGFGWFRVLVTTLESVATRLRSYMARS